MPVDDGPTVIVLPGPPRELHAMWEPALATEPARAVLKRAEPYAGAMLRLFGVPESEIAKSLLEIEGEGVDLGSLEITTCLRKGELEIEIRHRPGAEAELEALIQGIESATAGFCSAVDGSTIDDQLAELLEGHKIATAESCTGGLLAARLTELDGASAYVQGGAVTYSNEAKTEAARRAGRMIAEHGAVSPEVAEAMADGALERFEADIAVGITGIAGPTGGTEEKPVGYVCVCVKTSGGEKIARDPVIPGDASRHPRALGPARHAPRPPPAARRGLPALSAAVRSGILRLFPGAELLEPLGNSACERPDLADLGVHWNATRAAASSRYDLDERDFTVVRSGDDGDVQYLHRKIRERGVPVRLGDLPHRAGTMGAQLVRRHVVDRLEVLRDSALEGIPRARVEQGEAAADALGELHADRSIHRAAARPELWVQQGPESRSRRGRP